MIKDKRLHLYEEIMLLALRDDRGTLITEYSQMVVAAAILAELLLEGRISIENTKKKLIDLGDDRPTHDPIIDECLGRIAAAKRRASLQTWVSRLSGIKNLRHDVARRLCNRGILRADEEKVLLFFTRQVYPEIDPRPEKEIIDRLRKAIFSHSSQLDPRTVVLISLAHSAGLLKHTFERRDVKAQKERIEQIIQGELAGEAAQAAIAANQAAIAMAVIMPTVISTTVISN